MADGLPPVSRARKSHHKLFFCRELEAFQNGSIFAETGNGNGRAEMGTSWDDLGPANATECALEHSFSAWLASNLGKASR